MRKCKWNCSTLETSQLHGSFSPTHARTRWLSSVENQAGAGYLDQRASLCFKLAATMTRQKFAYAHTYSGIQYRVQRRAIALFTGQPIVDGAMQSADRTRYSSQCTSCLPQSPCDMSVWQDCLTYVLSFKLPILPAQIKNIFSERRYM